MSELEILTGIQKYFDIREFVDEPTYNRHKERAWQFMDIRLLHTMLILRENLGISITGNTWKWGGQFDERGLRTNICDIVSKKTAAKKLYLSAHTMGKAFDFDVKGMTAEEVRDWIIINKNLFPYKLRLEHKKRDRRKTSKTYGKMIPITWVHLDVYYRTSNKAVYLFNV